VNYLTRPLMLSPNLHPAPTLDYLDAVALRRSRVPERAAKYGIANRVITA